MMPADEPPLATKLSLPHLRPDTVARPRLEHMLAEGLSREQSLVLIVAPPGFGKTTLVSAWAMAAARPVAWVALDASDNDPLRFWAAIVAACRSAFPGIGLGAAPAAYGASSPPPPHAVVAQLVRALSELQFPLTLIVDGYHLIEADPIHAALAQLLQSQPAALRLVLVTRSEPPLPLARLRSRRLLTEVRPADLCFDLHEAGQLLRQVMHLDLPTAIVQTLVDRTEGWVAGLQLAGIALQRIADPAAFLAGFSGGHRLIADYLTEEVLQRQSAETQQFLLETSVLERMSGPLCDAVTGRAGSQGLLEELCRAQLFVAPLDGAPGWFRAHQLFAEYLRARLERLQPDHARACRRRASAWLAAHGLTEPAIAQALAAAAYDLAADLVEPQADHWMRCGDVATILSHLRSIPEATIARRHGLCLWYGWALAITAELDAAERWVARAEVLLADAAAGGRVAAFDRQNAEAQALAIRALVARLRGDSPVARELSQRALGRTPADNAELRLVVSAQLVMAHRAGGEDGAADIALRSLRQQARATNHPFVMLSALMHESATHLSGGDLRGAHRSSAQALLLAESAGLPRLAAAPHLCLGQVYYQRNELALAHQHLTVGLAHESALAQPDMLEGGHVALALTQGAMGHVALARRTLQQALQAAREQRRSGWLCRLQAWEARLNLHAGDVEAATRWARVTGWWWHGPGDEAPEDGGDDALVRTLCRLLIAHATPATLRRAELLLADQRQRSQSAHLAGHQIELGMLEALCQRALGAAGKARAALEAALAIAEPHGYVRLFVDEGVPLATLLRRIDPAHPLGGYAALLLAASPRRAAGISAPTPLAEPLNPHELAILHLLAQGLSNPDIARERTLAVSTVRWYVKHIYSKLGVHNRTQAAARARELQLLPEIPPIGG